jgi:xylem cysteine proteinase/KDEL-tailed cysteine endopeptidase
LQVSGNAAVCNVNKLSEVPMQLSYTVLAADDTVLMSALQSTGPISVGVSVNTNNNDFFGYSSGVMNPALACGSGINHVVLLVGYGVDTQTGLPYWLLKNRQEERICILS